MKFVPVTVTVLPAYAAVRSMLVAVGFAVTVSAVLLDVTTIA